MMFYTVSYTEQGSLSYMASLLKSDFGIEMTKQSLDERFNEKCVDFVNAVLREVLRKQFAGLYSGELLPSFSRIRIKDSTKFTVPPNMQEEFKACGGDTHSRSKAGVSVQYEYDLKSGEVTDLNITSGDRNDRTDAGESVENMEKNDLIIRDLGYFSTPVLKSCMEKEAFFLSRLDCSTHVYDANMKQISFKNIHKSMKKSGVIEKEMLVYVGKKTLLPVRMILQLVPEEVCKQRIREKTKKSKGQGRGRLTEETKIRCWFNIFITNAEESQLSVEQVFPLYRLRWQIELQFKCWKSIFKIDKLQKMKKHRYFTLLYIKLLLIIINLQITHSLQQSIIQNPNIQNDPKKIKVLSMNKALKTLKTLFHEIFGLLRESGRKAKEIAQYIQDRLWKNHWLESKKGKLCFPEILQLMICKSQK